MSHDPELGEQLSTGVRGGCRNKVLVKGPYARHDQQLSEQLLTAVRVGDCDNVLETARTIVDASSKREKLVDEGQISASDGSTQMLYDVMAEAMALAVEVHCEPAMKALFEACKEPRVFRLNYLLPIAAAQGDVAVVRCFLEEFVAAERRGSDGHYFVGSRRAALIAAAKAGAVETVGMIHNAFLDMCFTNLFSAEAIAAAPLEHRDAVSKALTPERRIPQQRVAAT